MVVEVTYISYLYNNVYMQAYFVIILNKLIVHNKYSDIIYIIKPFLASLHKRKI